MDENRGGDRIGEEKIEEGREKIKEEVIRVKYTDSIHHGADQTSISLSLGRLASP
jgi:hypothetical protein